MSPRRPSRRDRHSPKGRRGRQGLRLVDSLPHDVSRRATDEPFRKRLKGSVSRNLASGHSMTDRTIKIGGERIRLYTCVLVKICLDPKDSGHRSLSESNN